MIETQEDAKKLFDALTGQKSDAVEFFNETGFVTRYFFKTNKDCMYRSRTFGSGPDDWERGKLTPELVLRDASLINAWLEDEPVSGRKLLADRGINI